MSAETDALLAHIARNAHGYFDDLGTGRVNVALVRSRRRTRSALHLVRITAGTSRRLVMAKTSRPFYRSPATGVSNPAARPYLGPPMPADEIILLQYRAMRMIHERLERLGDPRLGAIRPLEHVPELNALIMEHVSHPTLASRLSSQARHIVLRPPGATLVGTVANAGAWLREYHALAASWEPPEFGTTRDEFIAWARDVCDYLAAASGDARSFETIGAALDRYASTELGTRLSSGLSHGDYAPRNIFASPTGRVLGFDAVPRWRAPIYLDLARFVINLRSSGVQVLTAGRAHAHAQLDLYETTFLDSYFAGTAPPMATIRLFQLLVLLDRWASFLARRRSQQLRWRMQMLMRPLFHRQFRTEAARILGTFEARTAEAAHEPAEPESS